MTDKTLTVDILYSHTDNFPWTKFWSVFMHPKVMEAQFEDGMSVDTPLDRQRFEEYSDQKIALVMTGSRTWGYFQLQQRGRAWLEIHAGFKPDTNGLLKKLTAQWVIKQEFDHGINKITATIPEVNRPACHLAVSVGMRREGRISGSFLRNGVYHGTIIYGMEAP